MTRKVTPLEESVARRGYELRETVGRIVGERPFFLLVGDCLAADVFSNIRSQQAAVRLLEAALEQLREVTIHAGTAVLVTVEGPTNGEKSS